MVRTRNLGANSSQAGLLKKSDNCGNDTDSDNRMKANQVRITRRSLTNTKESPAVLATSTPKQRKPRGRKKKIKPEEELAEGSKMTEPPTERDLTAANINEEDSNSQRQISLNMDNNFETNSTENCIMEDEQNVMNVIEIVDDQDGILGSYIGCEEIIIEESNDGGDFVSSMGEVEISETVEDNQCYDYEISDSNSHDNLLDIEVNSEESSKNSSTLVDIENESREGSVVLSIDAVHIRSSKNAEIEGKNKKAVRTYGNRRKNKDSESLDVKVEKVTNEVKDIEIDVDRRIAESQLPQQMVEKLSIDNREMTQSPSHSMLGSTEIRRSNRKVVKKYDVKELFSRKSQKNSQLGSKLERKMFSYPFSSDNSYNNRSSEFSNVSRIAQIDLTQIPSLDSGNISKDSIFLPVPLDISRNDFLSSKLDSKRRSQVNRKSNKIYSEEPESPTFEHSSTVITIEDDDDLDERVFNSEEDLHSGNVDNSAEHVENARLSPIEVLGMIKVVSRTVSKTSNDSKGEENTKQSSIIGTSKKRAKNKINTSASSPSSSCLKTVNESTKDACLEVPVEEQSCENNLDTSKSGTLDTPPILTEESVNRSNSEAEGMLVKQKKVNSNKIKNKAKATRNKFSKSEVHSDCIDSVKIVKDETPSEEIACSTTLSRTRSGKRTSTITPTSEIAKIVSESDGNLDSVQEKSSEVLLEIKVNSTTDATETPPCETVNLENKFQNVLAITENPETLVNHSASEDVTENIELTLQDAIAFTAAECGDSTKHLVAPADKLCETVSDNSSKKTIEKRLDNESIGARNEDNTVEVRTVWEMKPEETDHMNGNFIAGIDDNIGREENCLTTDSPNLEAPVKVKKKRGRKKKSVLLLEASSVPPLEQVVTNKITRSSVLATKSSIEKKQTSPSVLEIDKGEHIQPIACDNIQGLDVVEPTHNQNKDTTSIATSPTGLMRVPTKGMKKMLPETLEKLQVEDSVPESKSDVHLESCSATCNWPQDKETIQIETTTVPSVDEPTSKKPENTAVTSPKKVEKPLEVPVSNELKQEQKAGTGLVRRRGRKKKTVLVEEVQKNESKPTEIGATINDVIDSLLKNSSNVITELGIKCNQTGLNTINPEPQNKTIVSNTKKGRKPRKRKISLPPNKEQQSIENVNVISEIEIPSDNVPQVAEEVVVLQDNVDDTVKCTETQEAQPKKKKATKQMKNSIKNETVSLPGQENTESSIPLKKRKSKTKLWESIACNSRNDIMNTLTIAELTEIIDKTRNMKNVVPVETPEVSQQESVKVETDNVPLVEQVECQVIQEPVPDTNDTDDCGIFAILETVNQLNDQEKTLEDVPTHDEKNVDQMKSESVDPSPVQDSKAIEDSIDVNKDVTPNEEINDTCQDEKTVVSVNLDHEVLPTEPISASSPKISNIGDEVESVVESIAPTAGEENVKVESTPSIDAPSKQEQCKSNAKLRKPRRSTINVCVDDSINKRPPKQSFSLNSSKEDLSACLSDNFETKDLVEKMKIEVQNDDEKLKILNGDISNDIPKVTETPSDETIPVEDNQQNDKILFKSDMKIDIKEDIVLSVPMDVDVSDSKKEVDCVTQYDSNQTVQENDMILPLKDKLVIESKDEPSVVATNIEVNEVAASVEKNFKDVLDVLLPNEPAVTEVQTVGTPSIESDDKDYLLKAIIPFELDNGSSIRRSHRIKTQTKLHNVGRGLVKDKERFIIKDDDKTASDSQNKLSENVHPRRTSIVAEQTPEMEAFNKTIIEQRLKEFMAIRENEYKCERVVSKEAKKMVCDCFLTRDEEERGELGCGEDCLNRLLMIECGQKCIVGDRCTNRRFQTNLYAPCKVFRTEKKGIGIQADSEILPGEFIMEYVGEVLNGKQFEKRAKIYSIDKNKHYYFMALRSDSIIDATSKGNISRFINHSCDPNAETQKWTVNGELRIGFFCTKRIMAGEEITFDYQFQRYGKEAQKCFCEAENCRGWIGEEPGSEDDEDEDEDEDEEESEGSDTRKDVAQAKSLGRKDISGIEKQLQGILTENQEASKIDTDQLGFTEAKFGLTKPDKENDATSLSNLQAKEPQTSEGKIKSATGLKKSKRRKESRLKKKVDLRDELDLAEEISSLTQSGLKNQAHTLKLSRLMVRAKLIKCRIELLKILAKGDNPCRRLFLDYHGLRLLHGWMTETDAVNAQEELEFRLLIAETLEALPIPNKTMLKDSRVFEIIQNWSKDKMLATSSPDESPTNADGNSNDSTKEIKPVSGSSLNTDDCRPIKFEIMRISSKLIASWENLPEVFRIPKKERIEQMKEHEREADRQYKALNLNDDTEDTQAQKNKERFGNNKVIKSFKWPKSRLEVNNDMPKVNPDLSKDERRKLFAEQVAKSIAVKKQMELRRTFEVKCKFFGLDPVKLNPSDMPLSRGKTTGQWFTADRRKIATPPALTHIPVQLRPKPTNPEEYYLPKFDLPPSWKFAIDKRGRIYYYHIKVRIPQWEPPSKDAPLSGHMAAIRAYKEASTQTNEESSSSDSSDSDASSDSVEDDPAQDGEGESISKEKISAERNKSKKRRYDLLVQKRTISPRREEDRVYNQNELKRYRENKEKIRKRKEDIKRRKIQIVLKQEESSLNQSTNDTESNNSSQPTIALPIQDFLISSDEDDPLKVECNSPLMNKIVQGDKIVDELDALNKARALKRVRPLKVKNDSKKRIKTVTEKVKADSVVTTSSQSTNSPTPSSSSETTNKSSKPRKSTTDAAIPGESFTSSLKQQFRKAKEKFRNEIAGIIVQHLAPYRKENCKIGKITNNDDFKHLARKLTHFVLIKELRHCDSTGHSLIVTESVKNKSREFIKKYMTKYGQVYVRPENDPEFREINN